MSAALDHRLRVIQGTDGGDTQQIVERLDQTICVIVGGKAPAWRHQLLAITLVDLLGRLHPRILILCEKGAVAASELPAGPALLAERLEEARLRGHGPQPPVGEPCVTIYVGSNGDDADLYADARAWQSYVGRVPSRLPETDALPVVIGPVCAAARMAGEVFRVLLAGLIDETPQSESCYWSGLDYRASHEPLEDPGDLLPLAETINALLVGAGSVGGAATYALAYTPELGGALEICDPQTLEERNYVRAILAPRAAAKAESEKAQTAADALAHLPLSTTPYHGRCEELVASRPREQTLPLVLCAVDSAEARRSIQDCLPLELVNAACNESEATVSGHRTGDGPCVYCLHIEKILDAKNILVRLIAERTGLPRGLVIELVIKKVPLQKVHLAKIEDNLELPHGTLAAYENAQLDELYRRELLYGEIRVKTSGTTQAAVAAPFITALAGFLLAGEALKVATPELKQYRLGPAGALVAEGGGMATKYQESLFASPLDAYLMPVPRWLGNECLCRSSYRDRLLRHRYGLDASSHG